MKKWYRTALFAMLFAFAFALSGCSAEDLAPEEGVLEGNRFSSFEVVDMNYGKRLIRFENKPMVVNFWATWCPPCQKEMGEFQSFQEAHPEVALHLVSLGETPDEIRTFFQEESLNLEAVIDPTGKGVQLYRVQAIPTTLVVNSKGIIVLRKVGPITKKELEHALRN